MYGETDPAATAERTAFRRAEKQYKLDKPPNTKGRSRSRSRSKPISGGSGGGDLSAVVDFHSLLAGGGDLPAGIGRCDCAGFDRPVFCFLDRPEIQKGETRRSTSATTLVRKLRSSTLGLQFDWSKRNYDVALSHNKIPDALATLAKKMAIPAMPSGEEFKPEAAIVNYYGPSDVLGGHVDDMEADWTKPIVSLSLGCKCIFLLGGKTRDEVPTAMFPQSGDIALMTGEARERFHGVPRIFTELCKHHLYMELAKLCMHHLHLELDLELSEKRSRRLLMIVLQLLLAFLNLWIVSTGSSRNITFLLCHQQQPHCKQEDINMNQ